MRKTKWNYAIAIAAGLFAVLLGTLLPGYVLKRESVSGLGMAESAPAGYYQASYSAVARNTSSKLAVSDRLRLITGNWESTLETPVDFELEQSDYEMVALAQQGIEELYQKGLYPDDITGYENWYGWQVIPHKAVDTTFHTYTAYYWEILFEKYDGTMRHRVYVLEDGTVFLALADDMSGGGTDASRQGYVSNRITVTGENAWESLPVEEMGFTDIDFSQFSSVQSFPLVESDTSYDAFYAVGDGKVLFVRLP